MLLFLAQFFCSECLFRFLTTFSASMLSNLQHILLTSTGVSKKQLYSSHLFLACCTRSCANAQPDSEIVCLPLVLVLQHPGSTSHFCCLLNTLFTLTQHMLLTHAVSSSKNTLCPSQTPTCHTIVF